MKLKTSLGIRNKNTFQISAILYTFNLYTYIRMYTHIYPYPWGRVIKAEE